MSESEPRSFVRYDREGDVIWLTLDRQERLNAVHLRMRDDLWRLLTLIRDDPSARVVVLRGAGERAFSAGADITEFGSAPSVLSAREAREGRDLWGLMSSLRVPLIAAIQGFAYGAGLEMSLYCDLRVAAADARFAVPEVTLGYIPSAGGTQTLPRHLGRSDALLMATSGGAFTAEEAHERGLVHAVVAHDALESTARGWANLLAARPPAAVRAIKRAVVEGLDRSLADGLALERRLRRAVAAAAAGAS